MALFVVPVAAGVVALSLPGMRLVSFGQVSGRGPGLLAASLASLAVGLLPYGVFLLLARAYYALGDSRTPGLVSLAVGVIGVVAMAIGTSVTHGAALAAVIGGSHTVAYTVGCLVLLRGLGARTGAPIAPKGLVRMVALAGAVGVVAWLSSRPLLHQDPSRAKDLALVAVIGAVGGAIVLLGYRLLGLPGSSRSASPWRGSSRTPAWTRPWTSRGEHAPPEARRPARGAGGAAGQRRLRLEPERATARGRPRADRVDARHLVDGRRAGRAPAPCRPRRRSAIADVSTRIGNRAASSPDAYLTMGAGTRALSPSQDATVALDPDESYAGVRSADLLRRRIGKAPDGVAYLPVGGGHRSQRPHLRTTRSRVAWATSWPRAACTGP